MVTEQTGLLVACALPRFGVPGYRGKQERLLGQAGTEILNQASELMLQVWPVSKRVNSSRRAPSDDPTMIEEVDLPRPQ